MPNDQFGIGNLIGYFASQHTKLFGKNIKDYKERLDHFKQFICLLANSKNEEPFNNELQVLTNEAQSRFSATYFFSSQIYLDCFLDIKKKIFYSPKNVTAFLKQAAITVARYSELHDDLFDFLLDALRINKIKVDNPRVKLDPNQFLHQTRHFFLHHHLLNQQRIFETNTTKPCRWHHIIALEDIEFAKNIHESNKEDKSAFTNHPECKDGQEQSALVLIFYTQLDDDKKFELLKSLTLDDSPSDFFITLHTMKELDSAFNINFYLNKLSDFENQFCRANGLFSKKNFLTFYSTFKDKINALYQNKPLNTDNTQEIIKAKKNEWNVNQLVLRLMHHIKSQLLETKLETDEALAIYIIKLIGPNTSDANISSLKLFARSLLMFKIDIILDLLAHFNISKLDINDACNKANYDIASRHIKAAYGIECVHENGKCAFT